MDKIKEKMWDVIHLFGRLATDPIFFAGTNIFIGAVLLWEHTAPVGLRLSDGAFDVMLSWFTLILDQIIILVQWKMQVQVKHDRDKDREVLEHILSHVEYVRQKPKKAPK